LSSKKTICIRVNGSDRNVTQGDTVLSLLAALDRDPQVVAVERNGVIMPRSTYAEVVLESGDSLEIVQFVQGG
jgi:thiazole synthase